MTEYEKMRSGEFYDFTDKELLESYLQAKQLCARLQTTTIADDGYREVIEALIPSIPQSSTVSPPFHCDHGHGIRPKSRADFLILAIEISPKIS